MFKLRDKFVSLAELFSKNIALAIGGGCPGRPHPTRTHPTSDTWLSAG